MMLLGPRSEQVLRNASAPHLPATHGYSGTSGRGLPSCSSPEGHPPWALGETRGPGGGAEGRAAAARGPAAHGHRAVSATPQEARGGRACWV